MGFEYLQGWRPINLSGQTVLVFHHPHSRKFHSSLLSSFSVFPPIPLEFLLNTGILLFLPIYSTPGYLVFQLLCQVSQPACSYFTSITNDTSNTACSICRLWSRLILLSKHFCCIYELCEKKNCYLNSLKRN